MIIVSGHVPSASHVVGVISWIKRRYNESGAAVEALTASLKKKKLEKMIVRWMNMFLIALHCFETRR